MLQKEFSVGFTGTQQGLTNHQFNLLKEFIGSLPSYTIAHHGIV